MPIQERLLRGIEGFEETQGPRTPPAPRTPQIETGGGPNPYIRCPIPPLNANTDTLRQFDEGGKTPARRVIPLPVSTVAGSGNTTINTTVVASGSGGGGGSVTPAGLTAATVTFNVPALSAGSNYTTTIPMARAFQLISVNANQPIEVRMYASAASRGADIARGRDTAPAFETTTGLITDIIFDTPPYQWNWQNRVAANADSPQTANIYVTVTAPDDIGVSPAIVTIGYLPLEV